MKILMVAADRMELPGILAHATNARPATPTLDFARQAELAGHNVMLVANGAGARRAAAAVDAALAEFPAEAILSTGFCGALEPDLAIADIVVADAVQTAEQRYPALPVASPLPHRRGIVTSIGHVARTQTEKSALRAGGGTVVEMEAGAVASRAAARGIPFHCIRVISDLATEDMANDFNAALREDGHFDTIDLLIGALRSPLIRVPELVRLRQRCIRAARTLGDFIADCRF
jgi:adenosylhomocysteine nucleosidase